MDVVIGLIWDITVVEARILRAVIVWMAQVAPRRRVDASSCTGLGARAKWTSAHELTPY